MTVTMNGHAPIGTETGGSALAVARARCERIRTGMESFIATRREVAAAYAARDWVTLGYESFDAYVEGEFSEARLKLSPDERREAVAELRLAGMSQPAIGSVLGVSQSTVRNDLAQLSTSTKLPDTVTGADGKERPATRPATPDLAPTILEALPGAGRDGIDLKGLVSAWADPPAEKDLLRALVKLTKAGEVVVTRTWANGKPRKWASAAAFADLAADVLAKLKTGGPGGIPASQIAFLVDAPQDRIEATLLELVDAGRVVEMGETNAGQLWAHAELVDTQTSEPVAAEGPAPAADSDPTSPAMEDSADVPTTTEAPDYADLDAQLDAEMEGTDQRFRRNFSSAVVKAVAIWQFDVTRIAQAYAADFDREILPHLDEMERWCARVRAARKSASGLRLVKGDAR